jgi:hypothetical protein
LQALAGADCEDAMVAVKERKIAQWNSVLTSFFLFHILTHLQIPRAVGEGCKFEGNIVIHNATHGAPVDSDLAHISHPSYSRDLHY